MAASWLHLFESQCELFLGSFCLLNLTAPKEAQLRPAFELWAPKWLSGVEGGADAVLLLTYVLRAGALVRMLAKGRSSGQDASSV